jgi:hypothetical protein
MNSPTVSTFGMASNLYRRTHEPLEKSENQNELLLREDALLYLLQSVRLFSPHILPELHVLMQLVKACSLAFTLTFH